MSTLALLRKQLKEALTPAREIADLAAKANRSLTEDEQTRIKAAVEAGQKIRQEIDKIGADDDLRKSLADLGDGIDFEPGSKTGGVLTVDSNGLLVPSRKQSIGALFTASAQYQALLKQARGGAFGEKQRINGESVGFKTLITGVSDTQAGALITPDDRGVVVGMEAFARELTLRNVITVGQTDSDMIEYVRMTGVTNNAAPVAEATTAALPTQNGSTGPLINAAGGGYKPESGLALERVSDTVKTIAHWLPVTKRALADAAQIRTLIDAFLRYGLEEELEDQIVNGSGSGENFEGLETVSGTQSQAWDTDEFVTTRKARTLLRTTKGVRANAWLMNPEMAEVFDLLTNSNGDYYRGGPFSQFGNTPLWGLPIIETEAVTTGKAWLGDWRYAVLWDRERAAVTATDSHADFFIRNLVAVLAELRAGFGVLRPDAFVEVDLTA
jgi:HK97 family phage major capsid protein